MTILRPAAVHAARSFTVTGRTVASGAWSRGGLDITRPRARRS